MVMWSDSNPSMTDWCTCWHHVTNHLIISNDKDFNTAKQKSFYASVTAWICRSAWKPWSHGSWHQCLWELSRSGVATNEGHICWAWKGERGWWAESLLQIQRLRFTPNHFWITLYDCHRCYVWTSLIHRYIGLHRFFSHSPTPKPMYNTISCFSCVRYDLESCLYTIQSLGSFLYDINLGATATTILRIRGVQIPIDLVSSAMDSYRQSIVLFKPMSVPTSDPKSEFLCQSSYFAQNIPDSPESPRTPGTSPTPSSPCITRTVTVRVLSPSTWSRSSVYNEQSDLVVACLLKSSWVFNLNVTTEQR